MKSIGDRFAKSNLMFAFLLMGFSFTVMPTLMARELLVSFAGNELSLKTRSEDLTSKLVCSKTMSK
jgi:hypothetical protein